MKTIIYTCFLMFFFARCGKREINCTDPGIQPVFITGIPGNLDTFVLRKFEANTGSQNLIDTFIMINNLNSYNYTSSDSTTVSISNPEQRIVTGYDWEIFIPNLNRTISISEISSERKKMQCPTLGEPLNCFCENKIFLFKVNNQINNFTEFPVIYYAFIIL